MRVDCEVKLIHEIKGRIHYISDNKTNIIGKGINFESALDCYHRGMDLLQQKAAGIDINFDIYYLDEKEKEMASFKNSTVVTTATTNSSKTYEQGLEEAWEIARKIVFCKNDGGYSNADAYEIFGTSMLDNVLKNSIHEAKDKINAWEAEKNKPKMGDVVKCRTWSTQFIGIYYGKDMTYHWILVPGDIVPKRIEEDWIIEKTGKHFDIQGMLDEIK